MMARKVMAGSSGVPITSPNHPDLTGYYTGINISGTTLVDESLAANDGVLAGSPVTSGTHLVFDGTDDVCVLPSGVLGSDPQIFSASGWSSAGNDVAGTTFFSYRDSSNDLIQVGFDPTEKVRLQVRSSGTSIVTTLGSTVFTIGVQLFVRVNFDRSSNSIKVWVNETLEVTDTTAYSGTIISGRTQFGATFNGTSNFFGDTTLEQTRFFPGLLLSDAQGATLHNGGTPI
jgi:hypothetical protein